jgi:pimeloyl-ACP methyl ester carboxylesterase
MRITLFTLALIALLPLPAECQSLKEISYLSAADNTQQPAIFFAPDTKEAVPLVVALHTWSGDYKQEFHKAIADWCQKNGWAYIHPNFRGPNVRPEAACSELVVKDILSAVDYAKTATKIDSAAVYLVGTSGGGYASLVMAGRHPEAWTAVSAWVPIADLKAWYFESKKSNHDDYARGVVSSCGGTPGDSAAVDEQYRRRSPLMYLANAKGLKLHIDAGIGDNDVPVSHSLQAFNAVANPRDRLADDDIREFAETKTVPPHLTMDLADSTNGQHRPLFRRTSGNVTVTIFQGGHELIPEAAMAWFQKLHDQKQEKQ